MAKYLIMFVLLVMACMLLGETVKDVCETRGHVAERFDVSKENNDVWIQDYPDSTCVFYYKNYTETGVMIRCKRCGKWLSLPHLDPPTHRVIWYKDAKKESLRVKKLNNGGLE